MPNDEDSVSPGEGPSPPPAEEHPDNPAARPRSRTNSANRPVPGRMVGTPGVAARRKLAAEREMLRYRLKRQPQLAAERQGRRRGDAGAPVISDPGEDAQQSAA